MAFNLKGLLQDEEFLLGAGLLSIGVNLVGILAISASVTKTFLPKTLSNACFVFLIVGVNAFLS